MASRPSTFVTVQLPVLSVFLFAIVCALLIGGLHYTQRIAELERKVKLLRSTAPGRTEGEVVAWLGPPRFTYDGDGRDIPKGCRFLTWPSGRNPLVGMEDVKILINAEGRVEKVYYTDYVIDRGLAPNLP